MTPLRLHPILVPGLTLFSLLAFAPFSHSQNPSLPAKATLNSTKSKSAAKSPNVKPGEVVTLDAAGGTITLKDKLGKTATYDLTEKTRYLKNKREAEATAFKPGEAVVVHIHKPRDGGDPQAIEVADKASWTWLDGVKRNMTEGTITTNDEDGLTIAIGTDKVPLTYTVSDKTTWSRNGKEATASEFKAGDKVYIIPRSLPSGGIMARAVTDTPQAAAQMKERQATSVKGVVKTIDPSAYKLTVETPAGDLRTLQGNAETEVVQKSKPLTWTALKTGQHVGARIQHDYAGDAVCWRITIETGKSIKTVKKPTSKAVLKPVPKS